MADLEYSNEALEAKGLFYNKEFTVYVEGKDDPFFWKQLFSLAEIEAYVEDVGGKNELAKYIDKVMNEGAEFYIARDNDNSEFFDDVPNHENIITTYGYSIENSMYHYPNPIEDSISKFCRKKINFSSDFNEWLSRFTADLYDLIVYDIANNKFKKGISIFGDNCCRFLKGKKSYKVCSDKISAFIDSVKSNFTDEEINEIKDLIHQSEKDLWFLIKGHFITHALINLIKSSIRRETGTSKSVTPDYLYSITVDCTENWENRIDIKSVVDRIIEIKNSA